MTIDKLVVEALSDLPNDRYTTFKPVQHHDMRVDTCFYNFQGDLMADMQTVQKTKTINSLRVHCLLSINGRSHF